MADQEAKQQDGAAAQEANAPKAPTPKKARPPQMAVARAPQPERQGIRRRGRAMRRRSKRQREVAGKVDLKKVYPLDEAIQLVKDLAKGTRFVQTVEIVLNLGIDPRHADQMIRGSVSLPKGIGKTKKVIAFCDGEEAEAARQAGAIEVGIDELVDKISGGWMAFDVAIAHPRAMGKVGKLGRVLGPQGKMPSPKNGTVTPDVEQAVREFTAGKIEFRNDAGANIHAVVGKADFPLEDLKDNIQSFVNHIRKLKPATSKGTYLKKVCLGGTMTPAVQLEVAS